MVRIPFTTSFFPIAALAILTAMVGCEAPSSKESVDPELDAHSPQGCDPGAFYSCVCDDGTDGLAECLSSDDLAACVCDGAPVDTIDPADSLDDGQVADTATTDVVVPPEDGGTDVGDGGGPTMDEAGLVQGMVSAQIGKKQMFVHSAFVHLERQDEKSKTFTTDMNGHYVIYGVEPGLWRACAALDGLNEKTCTENFELGIDTVRLPPIVLEIEPPFAWGRVTLSNGQPCVYRMPDFNLTVDTFVEAGETSMVPVNSQGQFLIPGYSGPLKAVCEGAVVDSKTAGTEPVKMVFTDMAPDIGPVILSSPQGSAMRPKLGAKVNVSVSAGDPSGGPLLVRWRTGGASPMYMEGHNVVWPMPETPYNATLYGLVSNGKGHHVRIAAKARPGTPLSYVGQLSRENGEPLQGAVIRINNEQTMTNDQGRYQLILSGDAPVYVTQVRHPDYTPCFQIQHDSWRGSIPDELHNGAGNARCLKPLQKTIINAESGDIVGGEMLKINIPGSALQMPDGKLVTGPVEVAWHFGAPGQPLAGEPIMKFQGQTVFTETLGGLFVSFRNPQNPLEIYQVDPAKPITIEHTIPKDIELEPGVVIASVAPKTGAMKFEPVGVEQQEGKWFYALPGTEKLFSPVYPLPALAGLRLHMPMARFPGRMHVVAEVKVPHSKAPQKIYRPLNSSMLAFTGVPVGAQVKLTVYRKTAKSGLAVLLQQTVFPDILQEPTLEGPLTLSEYPFAAQGFLDVLLNLFGTQGSFLTKKLVVDVVDDNGNVLMSASQVGEAYYDAIDPQGDKTTLKGWLSSLDWGKTDPRSQTGDEAFAIYGNAGDLDFGREMHLQITEDDGGPFNNEPIVAMYTTNYADVHDAVAGEGVAATVAMEYSRHPTKPGLPYIKFFIFDATGARIPTINLDGFGEKAVPDLCANCHGGSPASSQEVYDNFNQSYPRAGRLGRDVRYIPYAVETFEYSPEPGFSLAAQEEDFRKLNESILLSNVNDDVRVMMHGWYGDEADYALDTLGAPGAIQDHEWYPTGAVQDAGGELVGGDWSGHEALYRDVYQPYCRSCHLSFDHVDMVESDSFIAMGGLIETYLCVEPTFMPQALITQRNLLADQDALDLLASELGWTGACPQ